MLIQFARCKFYTVGPPSHGHECDFYLYALVCSKRLVREKLYSHRKTNLLNRSRKGSKFGWYGKVNQKSSQFTNKPFHSHMNKNGRSSSGPLSGPAGFLQEQASEFNLLSPSTLEKISFPAEVPVFFRRKLLNFNLNESLNSFFEIILPMFFF